MQDDPEVDGELVTMLLPRDRLKALDDCRHLQQDPDSRQEIIRALLTDWFVQNRYLGRKKRGNEA